MKTDSQFYHIEGSVRLNLLESGQGDFAASLDNKTLPISSQIYKVVQKVVLWLGFAGTKPIFI